LFIFIKKLANLVIKITFIALLKCTLFYLFSMLCFAALSWFWRQCWKQINWCVWCVFQKGSVAI